MTTKITGVQIMNLVHDLINAGMANQELSQQDLYETMFIICEDHLTGDEEE